MFNIFFPFLNTDDKNGNDKNGIELSKQLRKQVDYFD